MKLLRFVMMLAVGPVLAGCTSGGDAADGAATADSAAVLAETAESQATEELESAIPPKSDYVVEHDPDAVYTEEDLPARGNVLKLNLTGMSPETVNLIIHRFKTERTPCQGETCLGLLYEAALVTQAHCEVTLRAARNVIREEKMKAGEWQPGQ